MKKVLFIFPALILSIMVLLSGCIRAPERAPEQEPQLEAPKILEKTSTLYLYGIDPLTLDPAVSHELLSQDYIIQIFSGLLRLDENLAPAPDIAERWDVKNGTVYTFYLRKDVKFHDGREAKASDIKYSWERACDPKTESPTASSYLGDIVGVEEVLEGKSKEISGVKVINDYTLQVTIDAPKSYFLSKMTYPTTFVVNKADVESGDEWWRSPNGTGPFKLIQWEETNLLVLQRNDSYYGEQAKVKYVVFRLYGGRPMNMYEQSQIDVTPVSLTYIDKVMDKTGPFYKELSISPELSLSYIGFNCTRPPFDDVNIRRAFSMAIDKDRIVSLVYRHMMKRADGILPPGLPGFNENLVGLKYDVARARQLIKESKYGDVSKLPPITITTSGRGNFISADLEAIIYQWRENLGVDVKVRQLEPERFFYYLKQEKDEMFDLGWVADYPHPQDFLEILFRSGADDNYGDYSDPEVDALLEKAGVEQDVELSMKLYQQAEQKMVDDAACIPLWFGENYNLIKPYIKGYRVNAVGISMLNTVSVERP